MCEIEVIAYRVRSFSSCIWELDKFGNKWLPGLVSGRVNDHCEGYVN